MDVRFVFLVIGLLTIAATLISLRREHIRTEYSVSWLILGLALTLLSAFPRLLHAAALSTKIEPGIILGLLGGSLVLGLVFEMSHSVSRLRDENVMLAQRVAILEYQVQRASERHDERAG